MWTRCSQLMLQKLHKWQIENAKILEMCLLPRLVDNNVLNKLDLWHWMRLMMCTFFCRTLIWTRLEVAPLLSFM